MRAAAACPKVQSLSPWGLRQPGGAAPRPPLLSAREARGQPLTHEFLRCRSFPFGEAVRQPVNKRRPIGRGVKQGVRHYLQVSHLVTWQDKGNPVSQQAGTGRGGTGTLRPRPEARGCARGRGAGCKGLQHPRRLCCCLSKPCWRDRPRFAAGGGGFSLPVPSVPAHLLSASVRPYPTHLAPVPAALAGSGLASAGRGARNAPGLVLRQRSTRRKPSPGSVEEQERASKPHGACPRG